MNKETKEILSYLAFLEDIDTQKKVKQIADYITNLQQENEDLKSSINDYQEDLKLIDELNERIEKAIEYIKSNEIDVYTIEDNDIYDTKIELLDILNGRSDE